MESARVLAPSPPLEALREAIAAHTGAPELLAVAPEVLGAAQDAFPALPRPSSAEGCTSHPALILKFAVPDLPHAAVKVILVPRDRVIEVRTRIELPAGSYRRETMEKVLTFLATVDSALLARNA